MLLNGKVARVNWVNTCFGGYLDLKQSWNPDNSIFGPELKPSLVVGFTRLMQYLMLCSVVTHNLWTAIARLPALANLLPLQPTTPAEAFFEPLELHGIQSDGQHDGANRTERTVYHHSCSHLVNCIHCFFRSAPNEPNLMVKLQMSFSFSAILGKSAQLVATGSLPIQHPTQCCPNSGPTMPGCLPWLSVPWGWTLHKGWWPFPSLGSEIGQHSNATWETVQKVHRSSVIGVPCAERPATKQHLSLRVYIYIYIFIPYKH